MLQHRIENRQQLAHAGREGHLLRLPGSLQALIESAETGLNRAARSRPYRERHGPMRVRPRRERKWVESL